MSRTKNVSFVKPMLEELEERAQPSFLLGGAVQQLAQPLNAMVSDMQSAKTDLNTQFQAMVALGPSVTNSANRASAQLDFGKAVGDWSRILIDQHAIQTTVTAELNFIHNVAFSELSSGDSLDALILTFGQLLGLNPVKPLNDAVTQANSIANDTTVHTQITTDLFNITALDAHVKIIDMVTPTF